MTEEKNDTIPVLPAYDPLVVQTLLQAYGHPTSLEEMDEKPGTWDTLVLTTTSITERFLLELQKEYFLKRNGKGGNRRLCLLMYTSDRNLLACVFEFSGWNSQKANEYLAQAEITEMRKLYSHLNVFILSSPRAESSDSVHQLLRRPLEFVFGGRPNYQFYTFTLGMLLKQACRKIMDGSFNPEEPIQETAVPIQEDMLRCIAAFLDKLATVRPKALRDKLDKTLRVLLTHIVLEETQKQIDSREEKTPTKSLWEIEAQLEYIEYCEKYIYKKDISHHERLKLLPLPTLVHLLRLIHDSPENLLAELEQQRSTHCEAFKQWNKRLMDHKKKLEEAPMLYYASRTRPAVKVMYQSSFIGVGDMLFELGARAIVRELKSLEVVGPDFYESKKLFSAKNVLGLSRFNGATLGLGVSYLVGPYSSVRPIGVSVLTELFLKFIGVEKIDTDNARVVLPSRRYFLTLSERKTVARVVSMMGCIIETSVMRDPTYLLKSFTGMGGGDLFDFLAEKKFRPTPNTCLKEEHVIGLFIASQIGHMIGYSLVGELSVLALRSLNLSETGVMLSAAVLVGSSLFFFKPSTTQKNKLNVNAQDVFESLYSTGCLGRVTPTHKQQLMAAIKLVLDELGKKGVDKGSVTAKEIAHHIRQHAAPSTSLWSLSRMWQHCRPSFDPAEIKKKVGVIVEAIQKSRVSHATPILAMGANR